METGSRLTCPAPSSRPPELARSSPRQGDARGGGAREAEQRMEKSAGWAGLFKSAFKSSRNAMVLDDSRRRILDVNGACIRLMGYSRGELLGHALWEFVDGGPLMTPEEWAHGLALRNFSGEGRVVRADDSLIAIPWGPRAGQATDRPPSLPARP